MTSLGGPEPQLEKPRRLRCRPDGAHPALDERQVALHPTFAVDRFDTGGHLSERDEQGKRTAETVDRRTRSMDPNPNHVLPDEDIAARQNSERGGFGSGRQDDGNSAGFVWQRLKGGLDASCQLVCHGIRSRCLAQSAVVPVTTRGADLNVSRSPDPVRTMAMRSSSMIISS